MEGAAEVSLDDDGVLDEVLDDVPEGVVCGVLDEVLLLLVEGVLIVLPAEVLGWADVLPGLLVDCA